MLRDRVASRRPSAMASEPLHAEPRAGDVVHSQASIDKARKILRFEPTATIEEGLTATVDWFLGRPNE